MIQKPFCVNSVWPSGSCKLVGHKCKPRYGWNPLRWLFHWPRYYKVTYQFEMNSDQRQTVKV